MRELAVEHVKPHAALIEGISIRLDKRELRARVDEAADQPYRCDAIHLHTLPRDPRTPIPFPWTIHFFHKRLHFLPPRCAEIVDAQHRLIPSGQPSYALLIRIRQKLPCLLRKLAEIDRSSAAERLPDG